MGGYLLPFNHSGLREITAVYISVIGSMDCVSLNSGDPRESQVLYVVLNYKCTTDGQMNGQTDGRRR